MRARPHRIAVRLNDTEYQKFLKVAARSGVSKEGFLRLLISGYQPKENPPPDYFSMMEELRRVGDGLNRIATGIHSCGMFDPKEYDENVAIYKEALRKITRAVIGQGKGEF